MTDDIIQLSWTSVMGEVDEHYRDENGNWRDMRPTSERPSWYRLKASGDWEYTLFDPQTHKDMWRPLEYPWDYFLAQHLNNIIPEPANER